MPAPVPPIFIQFDPEEDEDDGWYLGDSKVIDLSEIFLEMQQQNQCLEDEPPFDLRLIDGLG